MSLDLSSIVEFIDTLMDDTCTIVRNPLGAADSSFDEDAGQLGTPATTVVYAGKCKITSLRDSQPTTVPRTGFDQDQRMYRFGIPIVAPTIAVGDTVTILSSLRFPHMVGHTFAVRETVDGTFSVQQRVVVERRVWTGKGDV